MSGAANDREAAVHGTLVIPAYQPGDAFEPLVGQLLDHGFDTVIVVDDGSGESYRSRFDRVAERPGVTVLRHPENRGKGAALKTAFRHALMGTSPAGHRLVTVDADGQHRVDDVVALDRQAAGGEDELVLGVREFSDDVPWRSRFGNRLTRRVLRWFSQIDVRDSQTGLRSLPVAFAEQCLAIEADRYEFELECLLLAKDNGLPITQYPIATVYIDDNAGSHFRPVLDSLRVYWVFLRYALSSLSSFVLDIVLFTIFHGLSGNILGSTYAARLISGSFNFLVNKHAVFRSGSARRYPVELLGYVTLAVTIATLSGVLVGLLARHLDWAVPVIKIVVDSLLFLVNFLVQRRIIFRAGKRTRD